MYDIDETQRAGAMLTGEIIQRNMQLLNMRTLEAAAQITSIKAHIDRLDAAIEKLEILVTKPAP